MTNDKTKQAVRDALGYNQRGINDVDYLIGKRIKVLENRKTKKCLETTQAALEAYEELLDEGRKFGTTRDDIIDIIQDQRNDWCADTIIHRTETKAEKIAQEFIKQREGE